MREESKHYPRLDEGATARDGEGKVTKCDVRKPMTGLPCGGTITITELVSGVRVRLCSQCALEQYNKELALRRHASRRDTKGTGEKPGAQA